MKAGCSVSGLKNVQKNLAKQIKQIPGDIREGLHRGGLLILKESKKNTPVDESNLVAGARCSRPLGPPSMPYVMVYYEAAYALFVHENMEARHGKDRRPNPGRARHGAKFLERALVDNANEVLRIIRDFAKPRA